MIPSAAPVKAPPKETVPEIETETSPLIETTDWNKVLTLSKKSHVIIYFWAKWCPVCRGSAPVFRNVAKEFDDKNTQFIKFEFSEDNVVELGDEIGISGLPNVMVFRDLK